MTNFSHTPIVVDQRADVKLPKGWEWVSLPDVARLESGHTPSRNIEAYWGGDVCWLSLKDIKTLDSKYVTSTVDRPTMEGIDNSSARILPKGTVAFCRTASVGKVAILGLDMATSQDFVNWVCGPRILPDYLYYAFRSSAAEFDRLKQGTTHKTIYMPVAERFTVLLPPLTEQRRITAILDKADAIRRKREEGIRLTEELLRSTFLDMFGDPAINPKGWPIVTVDQLVSETQYGTAQKANAEGTGIPVLRMNNITYSGELDLVDMKWCDIAKADIPAYTVRKGDLLFNRTNSPELVGKTAVWDRDESYAFAGYLIRVRFDEVRVLPDYVSAYLNSDYGKKLLFARAKPSNNMSNLSAGELRRIPLPVPDLKRQREFARAVLKCRSLKIQRQAALACSGSLFDALVQRAFRGEL
ncbi:restriction endonuclease subunit S [Aquisphaera insulae]|uniref:restriction endonuclease subunit S n=1 Tax=Aquisphaera insulae TaxID=2712864 RepID=UPI0013EC5DD3|nr:restriction endonuclease subunit S [Aquisphaera insulae]